MLLNRIDRERVVSQGQVVLDNLEQGALNLSGSGDHSAAYNSILADLRVLQASCSSVREFDEMTQTFVQFEKLLHALKSSSVDFSDKVGGLLLHSISTFRHALTSLGTGNRSNESVIKVLQDLTRVMSTLIERSTKTQVKSSGVLPESTIKQFCEDFLRDDTRNFSRMGEIAARLRKNPSIVESQKELLVELFRLFHTTKGNAGALGFANIARYSHAVEDVLHLIQTGRLAAAPATVLFLAACSDNLLTLIEAARADSTLSIDSWLEDLKKFMAGDIQVSVAEPEASVADAKHIMPFQDKAQGFFLSLTINGRKVVIPCDSVSAVLRNPQVLSVPGGHGGWLGIIRAGGELLPLIDPEALVKAGNDSVGHDGFDETLVVVLKGEGAVSSRFAFPVDSVGEVVEWVETKTQENVTLLDVPGMLQKISFQG